MNAGINYSLNSVEQSLSARSFSQDGQRLGIDAAGYTSARNLFICDCCFHGFLERTSVLFISASENVSCISLYVLSTPWCWREWEPLFNVHFNLYIIANNSCYTIVKMTKHCQWKTLLDWKSACVMDTRFRFSAYHMGTEYWPHGPINAYHMVNKLIMLERSYKLTPNIRV